MKTDEEREQIAHEIIHDLDEIATDYNGLDNYGLPVHHDNTYELMKNAIVLILRNYDECKY